MADTQVFTAEEASHSENYHGVYHWEENYETGEMELALEYRHTWLQDPHDSDNFQPIRTKEIIARTGPAPEIKKPVPRKHPLAGRWKFPKKQPKDLTLAEILGKK